MPKWLVKLSDAGGLRSRLPRMTRSVRNKHCGFQWVGGPGRQAWPLTRPPARLPGNLHFNLNSERRASSPEFLGTCGDAPRKKLNCRGVGFLTPLTGSA